MSRKAKQEPEGLFEVPQPVPPAALEQIDGKDSPVYRCPHCGNWVDLDNCDCWGAGDDCVFCGVCDQEFHL